MNKECIARVSRISVRAASWNIAAVNNNPFEYWVTYPDPAYNDFMQRVEACVNNPDMDIAVSSIFTDSMFDEMLTEMQDLNVPGLDELKAVWIKDYRNRLAIRQFLKDKTIGEKRLASMPDRITNTINLQDGTKCTRPSVINAYDQGSLASTKEWWHQWRHFMFHTHVQVFNGDQQKATPPQLVCSLIGPIQRSKYPAVTEVEEAISVGLQILCLAVLDCIFLHIVNTAAPVEWEKIRKDLCKALIHGKESGICEVISHEYQDMDVFFIQEAAAIFVKRVQQHETLTAKYALLKPQALDGKRDQNSVILVDRRSFKEETCEDVTQKVLDLMEGKWVAPGDLLVVSIEGLGGFRWLLASFHGDSNGLLTQPLMRGLGDAMQQYFRDHVLLVGIDANTHSVVTDKYHQGVTGFVQFLKDQNLVSLWDGLQDGVIRTTCSARTYLQTQLNKATPYDMRASKSNVNLKDWILGYNFQMVQISGASRDNTGERRYEDGLVLPTSRFPSDHAIISAVFHVDHAPFEGFSAEDLSDGQVKDTRSRVPDLAGKTIYDYWGIVDQPPAMLEFAATLPFHSYMLASGRTVESCSSNHLIAQDEIHKICETHFRKRARDERGLNLGFLKQKLTSSQDRSIWILFTSRPLTLAFRKTWFKLLVSFAVTMSLLESSKDILTWSTSQSLLARHFRFSFPDSGRSAGQCVNNAYVRGVSSSGIGNSLDLLSNGCKIKIAGNISISADTISVSFVDVVTIDGWNIARPNGTCKTAEKYIAEHSLDGHEWQQIDSPIWQIFRPLKEIRVGSSNVLVTDLRPSWQWTSYMLIKAISVPFFFTLGIVYSRRGQARTGIICLAFIYAISALHHLAIMMSFLYSVARHWSADFHWEGEGSMSNLDRLIFFASRALIMSTITLAFFMESNYFLDIFATIMFVNSASIAYQAKQQFQGISLTQSMMVVGKSGLFSIAFLFLSFAREWARAWVFKRYVFLDRERFNSAWQEILTRKKEVIALENLGKVVQTIRKRVHCVEARQCNPVYHAASTTDSSAKIRVSKIPVVSLDQLFDQASCLDVFLRSKAKEFALASNGCFLAIDVNEGKASESFRTWEELQSNAHLVVHWAGIKPWQRALEKLLRSYDCDDSRLLDCCRQTIFFNETSQLVSCLEAIDSDSIIEVVRLKNRMDVKFDSFYTGGFRNVIVNLRIRSDDTKRLGIDHHICELQLTLISFAKLVSEESHKRYQVMRNCRLSSSIVRIWRRKISRSLTNVGKRQVSKIGIQSVQDHGGEQSFDMHRIDCSDRLLNGQNSPLPLGSVFCNPSENMNSISDESTANQGTAFENHLKKMLEAQFRETTTAVHYGSSETSLLISAVNRVNFEKLWSCMHPITAAIYKPWFPLILIVLMYRLIAELCLDLASIQNTTLRYGHHIRFTALELRGGLNRPIVGPGIGSLGGIYDGCPTPWGTSNETVRKLMSGASMTLSSTQILSLHGWWFSTSQQSVQDDPVRFLIELSPDSDGTTWEKIGSSAWSWTWSGVVAWKDGFCQTPELRSHEVVFDFGAPWAWSAHRLSSKFVLVCGLAALLFASYTKNCGIGRWILASCFVVRTMIDILCCIYWLRTTQNEMAACLVVISAVDIGFAVAFIMGEKFSLRWSGAAGVLLTVHRHLLISDQSDSHWLDSLGNLDILLLLLMQIAGQVTAKSAKVRAHRAMGRHQQAFEEVRSEVLASAETALCLREIRAVIKTLSSCLKSPARQCYRPNPESTEKPVCCCNELHFVRSLHQLLTQAAGADVFLRLKTQNWALDSDGCFLVAPCSDGAGAAAASFRRWAEVSGDEALRRRVRWAEVKSLERAVDKAYWRYDMDVSRLLDCCRQTIYYNDVGGLQRGLKIVGGDDDVRLVRVVNWLDPAARCGGSGLSGAGALVLKLCIDTEDTRRLGIESHVCELRLALIPFARLETREWHADYVAWRDLCCRP